METYRIFGVVLYKNDRLLSGPSAPDTVNLTAEDSNSILVSWSRPVIYCSQIDQYRVKYWRNDTAEEKHTMILPVANMDTDRHRVSGGQVWWTGRLSVDHWTNCWTCPGLKAKILKSQTLKSATAQNRVC